MSPESREKKIQTYANGYSGLSAALKRFPREMWRFRDEHGCWSVHEHIIHLADSEANSYIRCRRLIAEPGQSLMAYDENQWALALKYHDQSTDEALELFKLLRARTTRLIQSLPDSAWSNTAYHPENGDMTLDDWLDIYQSHVPEHVQSMQENIDAWAAQA